MDAAVFLSGLERVAKIGRRFANPNEQFRLLNIPTQVFVHEEREASETNPPLLGGACAARFRAMAPWQDRIRPGSERGRPASCMDGSMTLAQAYGTLTGPVII